MSVAKIGMTIEEAAEMSGIVILHGLAEHGFRLTLACCSHKLPLYKLSAFIFHVEAVA